MDFAINYSPEAEALLCEGHIQVDRFKCPDWPDLVAAALPIRPTYVHFPLVAGRRLLQSVDWARVDGFLAQTDTRYINLHLGAVLAEGESEAEAAQRACDDTLADIRFVAARYGAERVIVENVPFFAGLPDLIGNRFVPSVIEPDVIRALVEATGCGFLLDISHARITAHYTGKDPRAYMSSLPVDHLRELHVTGLDWWNGKLVDHMVMTEDDWPDVTWALDQIHAGRWAIPDIVALEYGGVRLRKPWQSTREEVLAQAPRLYRLVHAWPSASEL